jgi:hypothetical protein
VRRVIVIGLVVYFVYLLYLFLLAIEQQRVGLALLAWSATLVPAATMSAASFESVRSYCRRLGIDAEKAGARSGRFASTTAADSAMAEVAPEMLNIIRQLQKAGVEPTSLQRELAGLLGRSREAQPPVNDGELLARLESDIATIRASGKESHLIAAEIEFVRSEFFKHYPHLEKS